MHEIVSIPYYASSKNVIGFIVKPNTIQFLSNEVPCILERSIIENDILLTDYYLRLITNQKRYQKEYPEQTFTDPVPTHISKLIIQFIQHINLDAHFEVFGSFQEYHLCNPNHSSIRKIALDQIFALIDDQQRIEDIKNTEAINKFKQFIFSEEQKRKTNQSLEESLKQYIEQDRRKQEEESLKQYIEGNRKYIKSKA